MPNPKRKHTPHRRDCRRSANSKLKQPTLCKCLNCNSMKISHRICNTCGFYAGKLILNKSTQKVTTPISYKEK
ncbi:MAG: 50S ribosomal protein L32 [Endomicrobium sp.]|jgi:large subunit ribosomal protein L32|nr:50S ribosomal protein L32 [Endomicrobium sp.]